MITRRKEPTVKPVLSADVAVLIPCLNEALSIGTVVREFRFALPTARIYVYDNNSRDDTAAEAANAGAVVRFEPRQGKGFVIRRMFAEVEADVYIMVDGDNTYDAKRAPELIARLLKDGLDMVTGARVETCGSSAYRPGHKLGNKAITACVTLLFGRGTQDMLSGYRALSRRFVKSFPVIGGGFEIETEITVHALELGLPVAEVETLYYKRQEGSESKLHTFLDGFRIVWTILKLWKRERPVIVFGITAAVLLTVSVILLVPIVSVYLETGLVPRFPTLFAAIGLILIALLSLTCGLILDTVTCGRREMKRLAYLALSAREPEARKVRST